MLQQYIVTWYFPPTRAKEEGREKENVGPRGVHCKLSRETYTRRSFQIQKLVGK